MTEIKFNSPDEMWDTVIRDGIDLYALPDKDHKLGIYIGAANDLGTLYYYECDLETAHDLSSSCGDGEFWDSYIKHVERLYAYEDEEGDGTCEAEDFIDKNYDKRIWIKADRNV